MRKSQKEITCVVPLGLRQAGNARYPGEVTSCPAVTRTEGAAWNIGPAAWKPDSFVPSLMG